MNSRRSHAVERGSGEAPLNAPWILAVDLGNGGPKVAVVSLDGEVLRVAFRPVRTRIGLDGAATQDAVEWWTELRAAAREAIAGAGADGAQLHVVAITGQYGSSVPVGADGEPVGDVLLWADTRARDLAREVIGGPVSVGGFAPHKVLPFVRITGGAPSPSGADPTGHCPAAPRAAARRLREDEGDPRAGGLSRAPVHRARRGHPGVDARLVDHRQPHRGAVRVRGLAARADAARAVQASGARAHRERARPAAPRGGR